MDVPAEPQSEHESVDSVAPADAASIVVGHDGSPASGLALREAFILGRALGARVLVVRAWSMVTAPRPPDWAPGYVPDLPAYAAAVRDALVGDVRSTSDEFPDVPVECRAPHGSAAQNLVAISRAARMLVVGARGLGGLSGVLLGSVSEQCVRHADCPVLVTRGGVAPS